MGRLCGPPPPPAFRIGEFAVTRMPPSSCLATCSDKGLPFLRPYSDAGLVRILVSTVGDVLRLCGRSAGPSIQCRESATCMHGLVRYVYSLLLSVQVQCSYRTPNFGFRCAQRESKITQHSETAGAAHILLHGTGAHRPPGGSSTLRVECGTPGLRARAGYCRAEGCGPGQTGDSSMFLLRLSTSRKTKRSPSPTPS